MRAVSSVLARYIVPMLLPETRLEMPLVGYSLFGSFLLPPGVFFTATLLEWDSRLLVGKRHYKYLCAVKDRLNISEESCDQADTYDGASTFCGMLSQVQGAKAWD